MGNSSEAQYDKYLEDGKRFIGRTKELTTLERWFNHPEAPLTIFSITGMGGIGKSSLLSEMLSVSRSRCDGYLDGWSIMWGDSFRFYGLFVLYIRLGNNG